MRFNKIISVFLLISLFILCIGTAFAEDISLDNDMNSIEGKDASAIGNEEIQDDLQMSEDSADEIDDEDLSDHMKSKNILKSDEEYLKIDYPQTHDESHNIV